MKRTPEFVLGLIGSILGIIVTGIVFMFLGFEPANENDGWFLGSFILLIIQVAALVLSCLVNHLNNKLYGGLLITIGIATLLMSFLFLFVPAILYLISGGMAFRKLKPAVTVDR
ncbi:hypothetical protein ACQCVB_20270 [Fictibacillus phosphorivorans]|uniref:hypothetical protein n=1 Tax=Fictibacillus phosphorivorans TaxID=1221500 RepID=UPI003CF905FD